MGEPAGIGPDIALKAWTERCKSPEHLFLVIGDAGHLRRRAAMMGLDVPLAIVTSPHEAKAQFAKALPVMHRPLAEPSSEGVLDHRNASAVTGFIAEAVRLAMTGEASGIVTCPIQKETLYKAGFAFEGHTDFLERLARQQGAEAHAVMMLAAGTLRTIPVTIHIPLKDVASTLTSPMIIDQARIVARDLRKFFRIEKPRLGVTGLNPHAGEGGTIGKEEQTIIIPAIAALRNEGHDVTGPIPGDTAFNAEARQAFDAILCMYHDQALIPVKTLDFHGGVNVTLGLPFIRTSPDHGTALSLAGTGRANPQSLLATIDLASRMAQQWRA
jgi:4-hydroxythreonine-4-phosphate dehydrogenase